jgi:hypothetical protein
MRPATIMSRESANCTDTGTVTPAYFFTSEAVSGQAAIPENIANQPFVMGKGPWCMRSAKPPTPAIRVHTQATVRATTRPSVGKIDFRIFSLRS